ncbi:MAG: CaiB/BaiF CoA-transferase family protein [Pseudomonadota bacterium]
MAGPLAGLRVIEVRGIGPGPYAGMVFADLGADVVVVERAASPSGLAPPAAADAHMRGKRSIALNLKSPDGVEALLKLVETSDALLEGFRPGVAEKLGFGPETCLKRNSRLVYGRVTGWGQTGPLSGAAGHDINYISLTGALAAIGNNEKPTIPLNLIGDYAGGSLFLVVGMLAALLEASTSGRGQVVDAAITDGSAHLMSLFHTLGSLGVWRTNRSANLLDGAAPFYDVYRTADNEFVSIGSLEPQFFALLVERLSLDPELFSNQHDSRRWPEMRDALERVFLSKTRAEWSELLEGSDVCFAPVHNFEDAPGHPHNRERETYVDVGGLVQPAPAPKFSETKPATPAPPRPEGSDTRALLVEIGFSNSEVDQLVATGAAFE